MRHVTWKFHLAIVFRLHTVIRLKVRWSGWKSILFACSQIYYSEWKLEHIDISGRKFEKRAEENRDFSFYYKQSSSGQHIQKQEIVTKTGHSGNNRKILILHQKSIFRARNPRCVCSFPHPRKLTSLQINKASCNRPKSDTRCLAHSLNLKEFFVDLLVITWKQKTLCEPARKQGWWLYGLHFLKATMQI